MAKETQPCSAGDIVESLGFGQAQVRCVILAHGIWFVEALQIFVALPLTTAITEDLHLTNEQGASLTSMIFIGIAIGTVVSGIMGDTLGRVPPILACYALAFVMQGVSAFANTYWFLAFLRVGLGFAHGLGMPASLALVTECAPASHRKMLMGIRGVLYGFGAIAAQALVCADDASLRALHWRWLTAEYALPPALIGSVAVFLLSESPIFLSAVGRRRDATKVLTVMRDLNKADGVQIPMLEPPAARGTDGGGFDWSHLRLIFGRHLFWSTFTLAFASFAVNVCLYGSAYAFPKVATHTGSKLQPGYQALIQSVVQMPISIAVTAIAVFMTCRSMLVLSCVVGMFSVLAFSWTGGLPHRTPAEEGLYFLSQNAGNLCPMFGFLACFQLSVDLYPVRASATSAAICVAAGRLGAILAPLAFEQFPHWQSFYHMMATLCLGTLALTIIHMPAGDSRFAAEVDEAAESVQPIAAKI